MLRQLQTPSVAADSVGRPIARPGLPELTPRPPCQLPQRPPKLQRPTESAATSAASQPVVPRASQPQRTVEPHAAKPDTGRNDATAIDQYSVAQLVNANAKLAPFMQQDVPMDYIPAWARMQSRLTDDLVSAQEDSDADAVDRALKWLLVSHSLVLRGRAKGRGHSRFHDTVSSRFALWENGDFRGLLSRMMNCRQGPAHSRSYQLRTSSNEQCTFFQGLLSNAADTSLGVGSDIVSAKCKAPAPP